MELVWRIYGAEGVKNDKAAQRTVDVNCFCFWFFFSYPDPTDVKTGLAVNSVEDIFIVKARLATSRPHELKLKCAERAF